MSLPAQTAFHLSQVFNGGNWTDSNFRDILSDVTWQQALQKVGECNTIATLFHHSTYYITTQLKVLKGGALEGKDEESFAHPRIASEEDWSAIQTKAFEEVEQLADLIEELPEDRLWEPFTKEKYGSYFRNLHGMIEHSHYHLGQIAVLKKLLNK